MNVLQTNTWKFALVVTLSTGLGISCVLFFVAFSLCKKYRDRKETPPNTPSHVDLDTAMMDYDMNTQLHTPLPEPRIMQISEELPTKFSTLTRNRTKQPPKLAPLENYMGEPPKDTVIRYSTIGRAGKTYPSASPSKNLLDIDMNDPKSLRIGYENNQLYY